jgi:G-protein alpha subunit
MGHPCSTVRIEASDGGLLADGKGENEIRVLVMGAASSNKTTLAKQMRVWLSDGFTQEERALGRQLMIYNVVKGLQERLVHKPAHVSIESDIFHPKRQFLLDGETNLDEQQVSEVRRIYPKLRSVSESLTTIPDDLMEYAFSMLSTLTQPNYLLSDEEMFRIRLRTSGKYDLSFERDGIRWTFTDAGGQPNERCKWEYFACGMDAAVYVVALDEWDVPAKIEFAWDVETKTKLELAKDIFTQSTFLLGDQPIVILFNRYDLFAKKLLKTPISSHPKFSDYEGPDDPDSVFAYIKDWFCEGTPRKRIYAAPIVALSTDDVKQVGQNLMDFISKHVSMIRPLA